MARPARGGRAAPRFYLLNGARGLDILRIDRGDGELADLPPVTALVLPQWLATVPALAPHPTFGLACSLLGR